MNEAQINEALAEAMAKAGDSDALLVRNALALSDELRSLDEAYRDKRSALIASLNDSAVAAGEIADGPLRIAFVRFMYWLGPRAAPGAQKLAFALMKWSNPQRMMTVIGPLHRQVVCCDCGESRSVEICTRSERIPEACDSCADLKRKRAQALWNAESSLILSHTLSVEPGAAE
ncbi:hypothetical protein [Hyphomicrobium sp. CS1GBMeth3]|uniref:hypothetical protein n=1 Tax=Hyphomicrobium sp. CS1GBMeth3 TaxID=1892845 RepID=UPI000A69DE33|nr:hypothetical protein [Hyphomicrobium sp. CS1GBMeth3]